jgi:hypothetical protein
LFGKNQITAKDKFRVTPPGEHLLQMWDQISSASFHSLSLPAGQRAKQTIPSLPLDVLEKGKGSGTFCQITCQWQMPEKVHLAESAHYTIGCKIA